MPNESNYPRVKINSASRVYVIFYQNNKRYRLFNGSKINSEIYPNSFPVSKRIEMGNLLASEVYQFLMSGLTLEQLKVSKLIKPNMTDKDYLTVALTINSKKTIPRNIRRCYSLYLINLLKN